MKPIRAVTFDCWGTLVDRTHTNAAQRIAHLANCLPGADPELVASAYQASWEHFAAVERLGFSLSAPSILSLTLDSLGASLPRPVFDETVRFWEEIILAQPPALLEGVPETLRALQQRGYKLGLISDTGMTPGRVMRQVLAQFGLLDFFAVCVFSDELGVTKRRPQLYRAALLALGVSPDKALHVGDTPATDILGAQGAGLRAALTLQNGPQPAGIPCADLVVARISELPGKLASLA